MPTATKPAAHKPDSRHRHDDPKQAEMRRIARLLIADYESLVVTDRRLDRPDTREAHEALTLFVRQQSGWIIEDDVRYRYDRVSHSVIKERIHRTSKKAPTPRAVKTYRVLTDEDNGGRMPGQCG